MKPIARMLTAAMLVAALVACGPAEPTADPLPTAARSSTALTPTAASRSTPTPFAEMREVEEILAVGDARFVARSIEVAIPAVMAADIDNNGDPDLVAAGSPT